MRIFREIDSIDQIPKSPDRQVFGIHPTKNKILVPIDLCILSDSNPNPDFNLNIGGKNILNSDNSELIGTIENFIFPPIGNINPIVTLVPNMPIDDELKKIIVPSFVKAGDIVTLKGDMLFKGKILTSILGNSSLINTVPFPLGIARNVLAFKVKFDQMLQLTDIGSPIVMADGSTLGMLLTDGKEVFVFPSSLI